MGNTVFYALTRDTQPGTRVWFPGPYKIKGTLKEWTGPQDVISPHKWAIVTMEDGTERKVSVNRRGNGNAIS